MNKPIMELKKIGRTYGKGESALTVLKQADLTIQSGEIIALVGPSGSGKSTLLHIAGLLDTPTYGSIWVNGQNVTKADDNARTALRRQTMGFVYQTHLLLPDFSALENVMMPQLIAGVHPKAAHVRAVELLTHVGMEKRLRHRPGQLSGGEQQRVAIARALANKPNLLLADEPTGNLDPKTAEGVFGELLALVRQTGMSALIATHNPELAAKMDRRICVVDGVLKELD